MRTIQREIRERLASLLKEDYGIDPRDIQFSIPPDRSPDNPV